jgi:hypothetical protein
MRLPADQPASCSRAPHAGAILARIPAATAAAAALLRGPNQGWQRRPRPNSADAAAAAAAAAACD